MEIEELIKQAETRSFKAVFPNNTNHYDTMFGGKVMSMMDEIAFITATRFSRKKMVTASSDKINFSSPIPAGSIVELIGNVVNVGKTSLTIEVDVYFEEMYSNKRVKAVTGRFGLVAIDDNKKSISVL